MTIVYATPDELEALSMGEEIGVMRDGAVIQRGTPDELYDNPVDTYVAGKIGSPHMNMIKGKASSDRTSFETSIGKIAARQRLITAEPGEAALLGIRPNDIRVAKKGEASFNSIVQMLEPLGDVTIVSVETGGETLRMVLPEAGAASLKPGQSLPIHLDHLKFHAFRASSGQTMM
jgi:multiple sugar transport system ATP-binding protein